MTMTRNSIPRRHSRQKGATLIIALLVLVLIMMLGVTAMTSSNTQFKLAGNLQFEDSAMNNTEAAITTAERWLSTGSNYSNAGFTTYSSATSPHLHPIGHLAGLTAPANNPLTMTWNDTNSVEASSTQRYMVELLSTNNRLLTSSQATGSRTSTGCNQVNTYLITARGVSARGATKFVQSYYSVLSCPT
jgi:Tfp pilus assembly protein PilX